MNTIPISLRPVPVLISLINTRAIIIIHCRTNQNHMMTQLTYSLDNHGFLHAHIMTQNKPERERKQRSKQSTKMLTASGPTPRRYNTYPKSRALSLHVASYQWLSPQRLLEPQHASPPVTDLLFLIRVINRVAGSNCWLKARFKIRYRRRYSTNDCDVRGAR